MKLDRSSVWSIEQISSISDVDINYLWENPLAQKIVEIDLNAVHLLPLISGGYIPEAITEEQFKNEILGKLKYYENQGYIFLDGIVVVHMLKQTAGIPSLWGKITESDSLDESSATIRFDGSIFGFKDHPGENILTPFMSRGRWVFGHGNRIPDFPPSADRSVTVMSRELTAAILL